MKSHFQAVEDFRRVRSRAVFQELISRLKGQSNELMSYEEVRQKLRTSGVVSRSISDVPIDSIVGSVGRYSDFTRSFLPKRSSDKDRWARIMVATNDASGLPPVELYRIGDAYFVSDGHHRVSVAKEVGASTIQAYVTEVRSKIPFSADTSYEELIIKAEYAEFLKLTGLDILRPHANLMVTAAGQYGQLLEHIDVHRYFMGIDFNRDIPYAEAVTHWYDEVYLPVVTIVRDLGILRNFSERTETDLYLWISQHRAEIVESIGWDVTYTAAADDLAEKQSQTWKHLLSSLGRKALEIVATEEPVIAATTRIERMRLDPLSGRMFNDLLVPLSGDPSGWIALDQALEIAQREEARLIGIHVNTDLDEGLPEDGERVKEQFYWRCAEAGRKATFLAVEGPIAGVICEHSRWVELVVVKLQHPPGSTVLARRSSGIAKIIRDCRTTILTVPGEVSAFQTPLLVLDLDRASELPILFSAYISGQWGRELTVLVVGEGLDTKTDAVETVRAQLGDYGIKASCLMGQERTAQSILQFALENRCDLIIIGGYEVHPLSEIILGTMLDDLLQQSTIPLMIAQ